ncbi:30S ribosomal protein S17, chloroplastic-like [Olea europaea var. sylvestris]|uniref:30S ribosomal protein S17, chloroplastic-like n=1 Tax=Olea europaea var. sylvestris TaxID=158386 RepID=UPI000C1D4649|nr:30S ribosomal protein S17, chloroplastic-like [Olea europaea var. sylvestris]
MSLTSPPILQFKSLSLSTPFLRGGASSIVRLPKTFSTATPSPLPPTPTFLPVIRAMKSMQGRVTCSSHDETVTVQVVRLAPHPKYNHRVRMKKKYQAHDPLNKFSVGDVVQLEKIRPISKLKTFLAVWVPSRGGPKAKDSESQELGLPLESQQPES